MGAYLAQSGRELRGIRARIVSPPHVGESLVAFRHEGFFRDLDFIGQMEEAKFPHKFGAAWTAEESGCLRDEL